MIELFSWRWFWILLLALLSVGCSDEEGAVTPAIGERLPPMQLHPLMATDSAPLRFDEERIVVLNVWAPWCPPCLDEMPSLEALNQKLDPRRFRVVGITLDDRFLAEEFLRKIGVTYNNWFDPTGDIVRGQLGIQTYPATLLIGPGGILLQRIRGWQQWDEPDSIKNLESLYRKSMGEGRLSER